MRNKQRNRASAEAIKWFLQRASFTDKDYAAFEAWLEKDMANARAYSEILQIWDLIGTIPSHLDRGIGRSKSLN